MWDAGGDVRAVAARIQPESPLLQVKPNNPHTRTERETAPDTTHSPSNFMLDLSIREGIVPDKCRSDNQLQQAGCQ